MHGVLWGQVTLCLQNSLLWPKCMAQCLYANTYHEHFEQSSLENHVTVQNSYRMSGKPSQKAKIWPWLIASLSIHVLRTKIIIKIIKRMTRSDVLPYYMDAQVIYLHDTWVKLIMVSHDDTWYGFTCYTCIVWRRPRDQTLTWCRERVGQAEGQSKQNDRHTPSSGHSTHQRKRTIAGWNTVEYPMQWSATCARDMQHDKNRTSCGIKFQRETFHALHSSFSPRGCHYCTVKNPKCGFLCCLLCHSNIPSCCLSVRSEHDLVSVLPLKSDQDPKGIHSTAC